MQDFIIAGLGIFFIALSLYDFVLTTFLPSGQGPLTAFVNHTTYWVLFRIAARKGTSPVLKYSGLTIILLIMFTWILLLWLGVALLFVSDQYSVLNGQDKLPADIWEKIYYTGYALSTLGIGDYVAGSDSWRVITSLAAFVGLITTTMSITFLVPVISNAGQKRSLGRQIESLGGSPERIVLNSFDGKDFSSISSHLNSISSMIFTYAQNHLTYPVLHHMHNINPRENIVVKLSTLDEALNIYFLHIPEHMRPSFLDLYITRRALSSYLDTIRYMGTDTESPPLPRLEEISRESGIDLLNTEQEEINELYSRLEKRRKLWRVNLQSDGWQWDELRIDDADNELDINFSKIYYHA